jgi:pilus assembly protein CpaD
MSRPLPTLALVLLAAAAAGCTTQAPSAPTSLTPTEQFAIEVRSQPDTVQLSARNGELSPAQVQALAGLASRWRDAGSGPLVIEAPAGAQNAAFAFSKATAAARALSDFGVPPQAVVSTSYDATGRPDAVVRVGYTRPVAVGPNCAGVHSDITATFDNRPTSAFGCSVTANFAAQLANANDLVAPREMTPADATRRGVTMGLYQAGKPSGTPRSTNPREAANIAEEADR